MKILLIGLGSIGKRHLQNILHLGYTNIEVVSIKGFLPSPFTNLKVYTSIQQALKAGTYDVAILCTPTANHVGNMLELLQAKIANIYLEKPVSHSEENVEELIKLGNGQSANIVVGYDLHFDIGLQKVKDLLQQNIIGKIVSVNAQVGQYLPDWRPQQDYREGMSAKVQAGGGVMLDLVHEFDYLLWLFGPVKKLACCYQHSGALQIETEDNAEVLLSFESGVLGTIHLDYLQQKLVRNCRITGYHGSIYWDLTTSQVSWINNQKQEETFDYKGFERNDRFIQIMKAFLSGDKDDRLTTLKQGIESLRLVLAAKQSSDCNQFIHLSNFSI